MAARIGSALYQREKTGAGQYVPISLLRSALAMQSSRLVWAQDEGRDAYRDMRSGGITGLHPTRAGSLYISANTPHFWTALCELIGLPELATDTRYDSVRKRAQHPHELVPRIRAALLAHTALEWEQIFGEQVPCAAVRQVEDMFDDPQVEAEEIMTRFNHPLVGNYRGMSGAFRLDSGATPAPRAAPVFAQHSDEILAQHGYTAEDIASLRADEVIA
jgi:formyl-CoA transferase